MNQEKHSFTEYQNFFNQIFDDKINSSSIRDFLIALNQQKYPIDSMLGAILSLKERMAKILNIHDVIDVCGTGGDKLNTLNISTTVSLLLASLKIKVAKHGNKAVSSISGSADIFNELKIPFSSNEKMINYNLEKFNIAFLFAPDFHPSLKKIAEIRKSIKEPTIFNFIGPLLNPLNPSKQIIGISKPEILPQYAELVARICPNSTIYLVSGFDNMDELTIADNSYILEIDHGKIQPIIIFNPEDIGIKKSSLDEIIGKDPKYNAQRIIDLFDGKDQSAYLDIISLNAGLALKLVGKFDNIKEGYEFCKNYILNRNVRNFINNLICENQNI